MNHIYQCGNTNQFDKIVIVINEIKETNFTKILNLIIYLTKANFCPLFDYLLSLKITWRSEHLPSFNKLISYKVCIYLNKSNQYQSAELKVMMISAITQNCSRSTGSKSSYQD